MHTVYDDLPYPFHLVPLPGQPIMMATVKQVILPLVQTVYCVLDLCSNVEELTNDHLGTTLGVLSEQLALAITLLERLSEQGQDED